MVGLAAVMVGSGKEPEGTELYPHQTLHRYDEIRGR